jgi:hypothetical protein
MRFEVLTAVKMSMLVFCIVKPCALVGLKMKAVWFSEMLIFTYKSTWHYSPEDQHPLFQQMPKKYV